MTGLGILQRIGRSLMLPIAVLPVAGLFLRFGQPDVARAIGAAPGNPVSQVLLQAGEAVFDHLPLLFAVGVAIGFARKADGSTALSAVVGYLVFEAVYNVLAALSSYRLGVLGGILMGVTTALLFERLSRTRLPSYLAFFGGRRLVPIAAGLVAAGHGVLLGLVWPVVGRGFNALGSWIVANDTFGAGVYGVVNRLLVPTGLHHIPNSLVWFTFGEYQGKHGDLHRFFAGDPAAGGFMTGFFPIMMFALPAACLAIIHTAKPSRRKPIAAVMGSAALTSFLTGITEPIEFAFVFAAPVLYAVHAVLTGLSMVVMNALGVRAGFAFSAGFTDWALNFLGGNHERPGMVFVVGPVFAVIYYFLFRFMIVKFDLKTPGREPDEPVEFIEPAAGAVPLSGDEIAGERVGLPRGEQRNVPHAG